MAFCSCQERPRCELYKCGNGADGSVMVPLSWQLPLKLGPKFSCKPCWDRYCEAWATPIKGIDRPPHADEDWRPSLMDMMRHAEIAMAFENRNKSPPQRPRSHHRHDDATRYTPAQLAQIMILRKHHALTHADSKGTE